MQLINILREKLFSWILKRQGARTVVMPDWEKVRNVAILYTDKNVQHIIREIEQKHKEVVLFTMPDKKEVDWLTERPNADIKSLVTARHFDVLIDLTQQPSRTMQYMAMYMHADFKVGRHTREGIYDMIIDTPAQETPDFLYSQILRYIDMFGKK